MVSNKVCYNFFICKLLLRGLSCLNSINILLWIVGNERFVEIDNDVLLVFLKCLLGIIEVFMVFMFDR